MLDWPRVVVGRDCLAPSSTKNEHVFGSSPSARRWRRRLRSQSPRPRHRSNPKKTVLGQYETRRAPQPPSHLWTCRGVRLLGSGQDGKARKLLYIDGGWNRQLATGSCWQVLSLVLRKFRLLPRASLVDVVRRCFLVGHRRLSAHSLHQAIESSTPFPSTFSIDLSTLQVAVLVLARPHTKSKSRSKSKLLQFTIRSSKPSSTPQAARRLQG